MVLLYISLIITGFILLYYDIKCKCTEHQTQTITTLKNEMGKKWIGGTKNKFNNIKDVKEFEKFDKVSIIKKEKLVFNKLVSVKYEITTENSHDKDRECITYIA